MRIKSFNEMTEEEIVDTLKAIAEKYSVTYYRIGYSKEGINNTLMVCLNGDIKNIGNISGIIDGRFLGLRDIDGKEVDEIPEYPDLLCPSIFIYDTEHLDFVERWIKRTERRGKITWLEV